jgi:hypothetical protein
LSPLGTSLARDGTSIVEPDSRGVLTAFARIGYELEVALADLVDNSIDAHARNVLIRFYRTTGQLASLCVVDDGEGIPDEAFDDAMGFGIDTGKGFDELGKYGIGLKAASFSQAKAVTVLSRSKGAVAGRRWTADNVAQGWVCDHIAEAPAADVLNEDWRTVSTVSSGSVVIWDELDAFRVARDRADGLLEQYFRTISVHLGLHFHRFIESGEIRLFLDAVNEETGEAGAPREVLPLDPFGYPTTGRLGYPRDFSLDIPQVGNLAVQAHIWPRRSRHHGYLLGGGGVSQRQGFYFYRNKRLVQAGGWNGWRDDAEPHASLARARIDIPGSLDQAFGLNVQKSGFSVPAGFLDALPGARSDGLTFSQFIRDAIDAYRAREAHGAQNGTVVPSRGIPAGLTARLRHVLANNENQPREFEFVWRTMHPDQFFDIDREQGTIALNATYRDKVVPEGRRTRNDAPLIKVLTFLLLQDELPRQRKSAGRQAWLARCQAALVAAARAQTS